MALPVVCVEESAADEFVGHLVRLAQARRVGCAYDPATELGPLVTAEHQQAVIEWIARGVAEGAKLVLGWSGDKSTGLREGIFRWRDYFRSGEAGNEHRRD